MNHSIKIIGSNAANRAAGCWDVLSMWRALSLWGIGLVVVGMITVSHAYAFSEGGDDGGSNESMESAPSEDTGGHRTSDYIYTGNSFNFSMSKDSGSKDSVQSNGDGRTDDAAAPQQDQQPKRRPGVLRRLYRGIFGGN